MPRKISRRQLLKGMGAASIPLVLSGAARRPKQPRQPNILFLMSDDHAAHALSCYGSRINQTPNLDRIAAEGMRFDHCCCTNSLCAPSRATILTGKYSHINGLRTNSDTFDGFQETYPKLLRAAGYQTAMIGKWHLVSDPTGFDYWCVLPGQGEYVDPVMIEMGKKARHPGYVCDITTDLTMDFIRHRDPSRPFCVISQYKAPHRSWVPDAKHAHLYNDVTIPTPVTFDDDYSTRCDAARHADMTISHTLDKTDLKGDPPAGLSSKDLKQWKYERFIKDYLRTIASVDDNVGRLLDFLRASDLWENTIVVYTSDQGFFLGDHGWFDKRFMYEESLKMPFLVQWPGQIKGGSVNTNLVSNVDFAPTFLEAAGLPVPKAMQGHALTPLLRGKTPHDWRSSHYYQYYEYPAVHNVYPHYGVRTDRHKLIHFKYESEKEAIDAWELFDLQTDPHELKNLIDDPNQAAIVSELKSELGRLRKELRVPDNA